jgi:hypothetical protein
MKKVFILLFFASFYLVGRAQCITIDSIVTIPAVRPNCTGGWYKVWFKAPVTATIKATLIGNDNQEFPMTSNYSSITDQYIVYTNNSTPGQYSARIVVTNGSSSCSKRTRVERIGCSR